MAGERINSHRLLDPWYGRLRITAKRQIDAPLYDQAWIIGIERQCAFQMALALGKLPLKQCNAAHDPMAFGMVVIKLRRPFNVSVDLLPEFQRARSEFAAPSLTKCAGFPCVS